MHKGFIKAGNPPSVAAPFLYRCSFLGMLCPGMGNGGVFQLVPRRFRHDMGVMTGGLGGVYLASSLGFSRQYTGGYGLGFLILAQMAAAALVGITLVRGRWTITWTALYGAARV